MSDVLDEFTAVQRTLQDTLKKHRFRLVRDVWNTADRPDPKGYVWSRRLVDGKGKITLTPAEQYIRMMDSPKTYRDMGVELKGWQALDAPEWGEE